MNFGIPNQNSLNSRISMNFRFKNIWNSKLEFPENIKKKTPAPPRKKILRILEFLSARNSRFYLGILEFPRNLLF